MLPHAYELPAAVLLVLGGTVTCFAGYRLFRIVLAIYGFILGAMLGSSMTGVGNSVAMVVAALTGGVVGALALVFAYFVGIALVGAGLAALVAHLVWSRMAAADPPAAMIIVASIVGAFGAMLLQRYVIIVGTAFAGSWTVIVGGLAVAEIVGNRTTAHAAADVWVLYPLTPAPGQSWVPIAWLALGVVGTAVQLGLTGKRK